MVLISNSCVYYFFICPVEIKLSPSSGTRQLIASLLYLGSNPNEKRMTMVQRQRNPKARAEEFLKSEVIADYVIEYW